MASIFVGDLGLVTTEAELRVAFSRFGTVERVDIVRDRCTRQSRGFAFIEMANAEDAQKAISQLNGTELHRRLLTVTEARPKPTGRGGPGGPREQ